MIYCHVVQLDEVVPFFVDSNGQSDQERVSAKA